MTRRANDDADTIGEADARTAAIVAGLDALYQTAQLPSRVSRAAAVITDGIAERIRVQHRAQSLVRLGVGVAALLLVFTSATYAVGELLASTWEQDPGLSRVSKAGLVTELNLAQTHDDVTVTIERAYADTSRLALGIRIDAPLVSGGPLFARADSVELRDGSGRVLRPVTGYRGTDDFRPLGVAVMTFDTAGLPVRDGAAEFELSVARVRPLGDASVGPWVFRFTLQVLAAQVATSKAAVGDGVELRALVIAAPSEMRLELNVIDSLGRGLRPDGVKLEAGGRIYVPTVMQCTREGACSTFRFSHSSEGPLTEWYVLVDALNTAGAEPGRILINGPWRLALSPE